MATSGINEMDELHQMRIAGIAAVAAWGMGGEMPTMKDTPSKLDDILAAKGHGTDTIIAHLNPREAAWLKLLGGNGRINPHTGMLEFYDSDSDPGGVGGGSDVGTDVGGNTGMDTGLDGPNSGVNDRGIQGNIDDVNQNQGIAEGFSTVIGAQIGDPTTGLGEMDARGRQGLALNAGFANRDPNAFGTLMDNFMDQLDIQVNTPTSALNSIPGYIGRTLLSAAAKFGLAGLGIHGLVATGVVLAGRAIVNELGKLETLEPLSAEEQTAVDTVNSRANLNTGANYNPSTNISTGTPTGTPGGIPGTTSIASMSKLMPGIDNRAQYRALTGLRG